MYKDRSEAGRILAKRLMHYAGTGETTMNPLIQAIRDRAHPMEGIQGDYDPLIALIGSARFALLGEASHGTHEFYKARAEITKRLIEDKGFNVIAVEADWPDAYRINRYVRSTGTDIDSRAALADFKRFPTWMWRNEDILDFVDWLRGRNDGIEPHKAKTGFYGLDLYSMYSSMDAVLRYLEKADPPAAKRARYRYACFDHFGEDPQAYGYAANFDFSTSCEEQVLHQTLELQKQAVAYARRGGYAANDEHFFAQQNAQVVKNAEEYYRSMFHGRVESWNNRDRHMAQTLEALVNHLDSQNQNTKAVVWAHNSHVGDARATEMGKAGELNLGQLTRERFAGDAVLIGFTTYEGTVTAASDWDTPPARKRVRPGLPNGYEALFHEVGLSRFLLSLRDDGALREALLEPRLERAIGVIYRPETERQSHYFRANLCQQFDAVVHFDATTAVVPLESTAAQSSGDTPETFPSGI